MNDRLSKLPAPRRVRMVYFLLNLAVIVALALFALRGLAAA